MKKFRKALAFMLALCMVFSLVPGSVAADADNDAVATAEESAYKYNIVHVDCGRKYFSPDSIKAIIDNSAAAGFNQVELYLSDNQGFRFALDDMAVTTSYGTYDLTPALGDGYSQSDGKAPDGSNKYLTQSEMTEIIAYANSKGVDIVPCINVPGHMGAILEEFTSFRYTKSGSTSQSSISLDNDEAVAFALGITEKYATYFASQGCSFYNVGADEYANDLSSMGFEGMGTALYTKFVEFINSAADVVIAAGMTPRAFNDGFYYKDYSISVEPNKAYEVCYWSSGWSGYDVAAASTIAGKGHKMINTHGDYYWILGGSKCTASKAAQFDETVFTGSSTISDVAGSMFCIWCDVANTNGADGGTQVVSDTADVIASFGSALPEVTAIVPPVLPVTVVDEVTGVSVTACDITGLTVNVLSSVAYTGEYAEAIAYDITPATAEGNFSGSGDVKIPVADTWDVSRVIVWDAAQSANVAFDIVDGYVSFSATHFSEYDVVLLAEPPATDEVVMVSGTVSYDLATKGLESGEQYLIVYRKNTSATSGSALQSNKIGVTVSIDDSKVTTVDGLSDAVWTYTEDGDSKYITIGENYLYTTATYNWREGWSRDWNVDGTKTSVSVSSGGNSGAYRVYREFSASFIGTQTTTAYIKGNSNNSGWTVASGTSGSDLYFYKLTSTAEYQVDAALQTERIDNLGLGTTNPGYTVDSWTAYQTALNAAQAKLTEVEGKTYSSKAEADDALKDLKATVDALEVAYDALEREITVSYTLEDEVIYSETLAVKANATSVTLSTFAVGDKFYAPVDKNLTLTGATEYVVPVEETQEDISNAAPLTIEFWITNAQVTANGAESMTVSAEDAYGVDGVLLEDIVPATGVRTVSTSTSVILWKVVRLDGENHQVKDTDKGADKTGAGVTITRVRYLGGTWSYYTEAGKWVSVLSDDQIVAYYLQKTLITDLNVIETQVVDWGVVYGQESYSDTNFVALDFAVKYEDGTMVPSAFAVSGKTLMFHCNMNSDKDVGVNVLQDANDNWYRRIGAIRAIETANYEVYMITLTPSDDDPDEEIASSARNVRTINYAGTEKVVWVDNANNLGKFADTSLQHADFEIGGDSSLPKIDIYNQQSVLITYYVRAKITEDSLAVHYVDATTGGEGTEFYSYNIAVKEGTYFNSGIALNSADPIGELLNGSVTTIAGVTQTVSSDLATMPQIESEYRYSSYTCVKVERSADGREVTLYYTFNNNHVFVVDFGRPIRITLEALNIQDSSGTVTASKPLYGTVTVDGVITYTPTQVLVGVDSFNVTITDSDGKTVTHRVYIGPATTVYYEETFAKYTNSASGAWTFDTTNAVTGPQQLSSPGNKHNYGFDSVYAGVMGNSFATSPAGASNINNEATFTFKGTGVDVYANCTADTGIMVVLIKDANNNYVGYYRVDTSTGVGESSATDFQPEVGYGLPVVSERDLAYGTYTVIVRHGGSYSAEGTVVKPINFDGFRVYNSLDHAVDSYYAEDNEASPNYVEIRDSVITGIGTEYSGRYYSESDLAGAAGQVHSSTANQAGAVIFDSDTILSVDVDLTDLVDNGPKNELYLKPGMTVTFKVADGISNLQVGLKAIDKATVAKIVVGNGNDSAKTIYDVGSAIDMFYKIDTTNGKIITITNGGTVAGEVLSVTLLKYFGTPGSTQSNASTDGTDDVATASEEVTVASPFAVMSEEDYRTAFRMIGMLTAAEAVPEVPEVPEEPVVPEEPEVPEVPEDTQPPVTEDTTTEGTEGDETEPPEVDEEETTKPNKPGKEDKPNKPNKPGKEDKPNKNEKPNNGNSNSNKPGKNDKTDKNDQSQSSSRPSYNMSTVTDTVKSIVSMLSSLVNYLMFR